MSSFPHRGEGLSSPLNRVSQSRLWTTPLDAPSSSIRGGGDLRGSLRRSPAGWCDEDRRRDVHLPPLVHAERPLVGQPSRGPRAGDRRWKGRGTSSRRRAPPPLRQDRVSGRTHFSPRHPQPEGRTPAQQGRLAISNRLRRAERVSRKERKGSVAPGRRGNACIPHEWRESRAPPAPPGRGPCWCAFPRR
jgi:hypothetical protein